jgi:hypothetical protein
MIRSYPKKLFDTDDIALNKVERHWYFRVYRDVFGSSKRTMPKALKYWDQNKVLEYFNVRGFQYGNWLNQEDRYQYLIGCAVSMHDLTKITGLKPQQIGMEGALRVAFGARGKSKALAHYEPATRTINLTRYKEQDSANKKMKYFMSGGSGSFGHEWAHALDGHIQTNIAKRNKLDSMLSPIIMDCIVNVPGSGIAYNPPRSGVERLMADLMASIMLTKQANSPYYKYSAHYNRIQKACSEGLLGNPKYWLDPAELFARSFEVFISKQMKKLPYTNRYLSQLKYDSLPYQTPRESTISETHWKALLKECSKSIQTSKRGLKNQLKIYPNL